MTTRIFEADGTLSLEGITLRIRTPNDAPTVGDTITKWSLFAIGLAALVLWWGFTFVGMAVPTFKLITELGYDAPYSELAKSLSAFGGGSIAFWAGKQLLKFLDEQVVGRTRVTYIRTTENESTSPLKAIASSDEIVTEMMKTINSKCKGSTIESRTNRVLSTNHGFRVTTYVTVLVAGYPLTNDKLRRDDPVSRCSETLFLRRRCTEFTNHTSGLCARHQR